LDFIADTGDGGNPTYAVARALAAPELVVPVSSSKDGPETATAAAAAAGQQATTANDNRNSRISSSSSSSVMYGAKQSEICQNGQLELPRGEVLLLGGDLAYPNPSRETFEQRLFVPFQEAMPPPPHYHPGT
jgi:hypothetical protein